MSNVNANSEVPITVAITLSCKDWFGARLDGMALNMLAAF